MESLGRRQKSGLIWPCVDLIAHTFAAFSEALKSPRGCAYTGRPRAGCPRPQGATNWMFAPIYGGVGACERCALSCVGNGPTGGQFGPVRATFHFEQYTYPFLIYTLHDLF